MFQDYIRFYKISASRLLADSNTKHLIKTAVVEMTSQTIRSAPNRTLAEAQLIFIALKEEIGDFGDIINPPTTRKYHHSSSLLSFATQSNAKLPQ